MLDKPLVDLWVYLSASPLFGLTVTLVAYGIAWRIHQLLRSNAFANPVAIAVILLITLLVFIDMPYRDYFSGAQFIHFLLGPATVALAIPIYRQLKTIKRLLLPLSAGIFTGVIVGVSSSVLIAKLFGADMSTWLSLAPKSVTAPVAMSIAETIGGIPALTAVLVVTTGIIGAVSGGLLFKLLKIDDDETKGIAMGATAHGIGTARAFQYSQTMGAFSGLAMALSALATSIVLPWLIMLF